MLRKNRKKYSSVHWRVDSNNNLYVYNENDLLFTRAEYFDYDEKSVADVIGEEYGNDWCFACESADYEDEVDNASNEKENEDKDDDIDMTLSDGIPEISALSDGIFIDERQENS